MASVKCDVEYDRNCTIARKQVSRRQEHFKHLMDDLMSGGICVGIQVWQLQTDREGEMLPETDRLDLWREG